MGEEQEAPAVSGVKKKRPGVDPDHIAYQGPVELINAQWSLDTGRTVELRLAGDAYTRLHPFKRFQQRRNGRMGTRFRCAVANPDDGNRIAFASEVMLAGWKDSSYGGQSFTLWLDEEADRHPFAGFGRRKNGTPGQMFIIALVEIDDNDEAVGQQQRERAHGSGGVPATIGAPGTAVARTGAPPARGRKLSSVAHLIVTSPMFVRYLQETRPNLAKWTPELARRWVKGEINVESLSQLDRESAAAKRFEEQIRKPYARWSEQEP
jgi:hypothetical protein